MTYAAPDGNPDPPSLLTEIVAEIENEVQQERLGGWLESVVTIVHQVGEVTAPGAGFQLTPAGTDEQITQCGRLRNDYEQAFRKAGEAASTAKAPAHDSQGSEPQAARTRSALLNLQSAIQAQIEYLVDWQQKLVQAKQRYMDTEHVTEAQWKRLAGGLHP